MCEVRRQKAPPNGIGFSMSHRNARFGGGFVRSEIFAGLPIRNLTREELVGSALDDIVLGCRRRAAKSHYMESPSDCRNGIEKNSIIYPEFPGC